MQDPKQRSSLFGAVDAARGVVSYSVCIIMYKPSIITGIFVYYGARGQYSYKSEWWSEAGVDITHGPSIVAYHAVGGVDPDGKRRGPRRRRRALL